MNFDLDFPYAHGGPAASARFRSTPEDFIVEEDLGFAPEGEGEHVYLQIRKRGTNTEWLAEQLAKYSRIRSQNVGYCGLKDRHAETTQWFSLYMPKQEAPDWSDLPAVTGAELEILCVTKGQRKLRRGQHASNRFRLVLRELEADSSALEARLEAVAREGVPNYFGEQRFGRQGQNLQLADEWLREGKTIKARAQKSRAMSAARSYIFNRVLAERVLSGTWAEAAEGDALTEDGLPTGPLWGRGRSAATGAAGELEQKALVEVLPWLNGLEHCGLTQERRPLVQKTKHFSWSRDGQVLELRFELPPGQYATSVLRELAHLSNASGADSPV